MVILVIVIAVVLLAVRRICIRQNHTLILDFVDLVIDPTVFIMRICS